MSRGNLRPLSEAQVLRVLASGGMLVAAGRHWRAYRSQDARMKAAGQITPLIARRLQSEGIVWPDPDRPGRFIASCLQAAPAETRLPPPAHLVRPGTSRKAVSLYATTVSHAASAASEPGERVRLKAAAQRFLADVRLAAASPELPLRRAGQPASADPEVALGRLAALESAIGLNLFRQLECLLVDGAAEQVFARESGHKVHEAQGAALAALRTLARAYDLAVPRRRA